MAKLTPKQKQHQANMIYRQLVKDGLEPDTLDIMAHIDSTLTYKENLVNVRSQFKRQRHNLNERVDKDLTATLWDKRMTCTSHVLSGHRTLMNDSGQRRYSLNG